MKEVFTKSFWEGVKKTFDEAREGPPPANTASQTPAEGDLRCLFNVRDTIVAISFERAALTSRGNPPEPSSVTDMP